MSLHNQVLFLKLFPGGGELVKLSTTVIPTLLPIRQFCGLNSFEVINREKFTLLIVIYIKITTVSTQIYKNIVIKIRKQYSENLIFWILNPIRTQQTATCKLIKALSFYYFYVLLFHVFK